MDTIRSFSGTDQSRSLTSDIALDAEFFRTPDGKAFARVKTAACVEVHPVDSEGFRKYLAYSIYQARGEPASKRELEDTILLAQAKATYEGAVHLVYCRVAEIPGAFYLDIGDETRDAIKIDKSGYSVVPQPDMNFVRPPGFLSIERPVDDPQAPERFKALFGLSDAQFHTIVVWLLQFFYSFGHLLLLIRGEGRYQLARALRSLVDANSTPLRANPRDQADFMIGAGQNGIVALAIHKMTARLSEGLRLLLSGAGLGRRKTYTDDQEIVLGGRRPVILVADDDVAINDALGAAVLTVQLPARSASERRKESDLEAEWARLRAGFLGYLLKGLGTVLDLADYKPSRLPFHAEFGLLGELAEASFDWPEGSFVAAYISACLASSAATATLVRFARHQRNWVGTAESLLEELNNWATSDELAAASWPDDPAGLGKGLRQAAPLLEDFGLSISFWRNTGGDRQRNISLKFTQAGML